MKLPTPPTKLPIIPKGLCQCGCGNTTVISAHDRPCRNWIKNEPRKFYKSHHTKCVIECLLDESTGCWNWQKGKTTRGYGVLRINNKNIYAHRHYYTMAYGTLTKEIDVLHRCNNPSCVNPEHLFLGTAKDNTQDMMRKGRGKYIAHYGENNVASKLRNEQIVAIRQLSKDGWDYSKIADTFNTSKAHISSIVRRKGWKHI